MKNTAMLYPVNTWSGFLKGQMTLHHIISGVA